MPSPREDPRAWERFIASHPKQWRSIVKAAAPKVGASVSAELFRARHDKPGRGDVADPQANPTGHYCQACDS
eukprot:8756180-Alexandrium_andersonii.AAC.1